MSRAEQRTVVVGMRVRYKPVTPQAQQMDLARASEIWIEALSPTDDCLALRCRDPEGNLRVVLGRSRDFVPLVP
jgi:hypothetical protein